MKNIISILILTLLLVGCGNTTNYIQVKMDGGVTSDPEAPAVSVILINKEDGNTTSTIPTATVTGLPIGG
jgi:PBP1b-binding outer membrane lipoprotein LpoB